MKTPLSEENEYNSVLFVEGKNDKGFLEGLIKTSFPHLLGKIKIEVTGGESGLNKRLELITTDLLSKPIKSIGIILDQDNHSVEERFSYINSCLSQANFNNSTLNVHSTDGLAYFMGKELKIHWFLMSAENNKGELIDLLKEIKVQEDDISTCMLNCLQQKSDFTPKEIADDWLHFYLKWDCSNFDQRKKSAEIGLDKEPTQNRITEIFNLYSDHTILENLKQLLAKLAGN